MRRLTESKGTALIEAAFTLPLICALIFFAIELVKINLTQVAVDSITRECTFSLIASGNIKEFDTIINKYRPGFVPKDRFRYYFQVFNDLSTMMANSPYGGQSIGYPSAGSLKLTSGQPLLNKFQTQITQTGEISDISFLNTTGAQGKAFVLTVVVNYPFSSEFTRKFFSGGTNATKEGYYILWGRGSGIVNMSTN